MPIDEMAIVEVLEDILGKGVKIGQVGTVVDILGFEDAYLVEFSNDIGQTVALVVLQPDQLKLYSSTSL